MKTSIAQRFSQVLKAYNFNQSTFAEKANISQPAVSSALNSDWLTKNILLAVIKVCPGVNLDWLITGRGEMLLPTNGVEIVRRYDDAPPADLSVIPLFPDWVAASAGFDVTTEAVSPDLDKIVLPNMPQCDGAILVHGDSMYPILKAGDYVCFKMLPADVDAIAYGDMYIIDYELGGDNMISVKYIDKSDKGDNYIKLVSYNQHYTPIDVPLANVRHIARVKISIRLH